MFTRFASQCLLWLCICVCQVFAGEEPRLYTGTIEVPGIGNMGMTLGVSESDEGTFLLLSVPMQGVDSLPLDATYTFEGSLMGSLEQAKLVITVKENSDFTLLQGKMEQGGKVYPIEFERVLEKPELNRPQTPSKPYPYTSREIIAIHPDGHRLAGTLTIPKGEGPFACAVMITGSGQQDRNETLMGHQPFLVIADNLTRRGIAVLRFDDRGVGGSVMDHPEDLKQATSADFASDVAVMVHAARLHKDIIDARRIGVIGHSEGGLIGPMVAVEDDRLAFVVMLAGPGVPGYELLPVQQAMVLESMDVEQSLIDNVVHASMSLYELMAVDANDDELREQLIEVIQTSLAATGEKLPEGGLDTLLETALQEMKGAWLQYFLFYDPAPVLARVGCPVLALNGTKDVQVSSTQNLPVIEQTILDAGGDITIMELEGLNHLFQQATSGAVSEYVQIETTFDTNALMAMGDWLLEVTDND